MKQVKAPIISVIEVMPETYLFRLAAPDIATQARPGQFVMVRCGKDTILPRPLGIHSAEAGEITLLFSVVGKGTAWLSQLKKGDSLDIFGPLGNGYTIEPRSKNVLLVAGGMGIAPLYFLAETAASRGCAVRLHQGVNTDGQVLLNALQSHYIRLPHSGMPASATQYAIAGTIECTASTAIVSSAWPTGLATVCVPGLAAWADQVFACGPMAMYKTMAQMPELKNIPVQLSLEIMMGCGTGVCYGCTIKTKNGLKQVCKDGPVFEMGEVQL